MGEKLVILCCESEKAFQRHTFNDIVVDEMGEKEINLWESNIHKANMCEGS